ncbi:MAG: rod shape-determining protein MreD [Paracoccaceae bacterium]
MVEFSPSRIWSKRLIFIGICLVIMFFHLLPLNTLPGRWAGPDLLLCFALAWCLRRPDLAPVTIIAGVLLLADFLFQRPPGLIPLLVVIAHEYLQRRGTALRDASFAGEWLAVSIVVVGITFGNRLVLMLTGADQPRLALDLIQLFMTLIAYPIVVAITQTVFGVRNLAPAEANAIGAFR